MTNAERFIEKYKELEAAVRSVYHLKKNDSVSFCLQKHPKFEKYKEDFDFCRDVRNFIQHERKINNKFVIQPSEEMISFLDDLISVVRNRKRCIDAATTQDSVYFATMDSRVADVVSIMKKRGFSHIPVLKNGVVKGVFSESSVLACLESRGSIAQMSDLVFSDIEEFLSLSIGSQKYIFFDADQYVDVLEKTVEDAYKNSKRIAMVFLTKNADPNGKLLGIMTPWDIMSANN